MKMARRWLCLWCCLLPVVTRADEKTPEKEPAKDDAAIVATSEEALSKLVVAAMDAKDYRQLEKLHLPMKFFKLAGAPAEVERQYQTYLDEFPKLAVAYRKQLSDEGWLPLKQWRYRDSPPDKPRDLNGVKVTVSNGIRLTSADEKKGLELVDNSIAIDGRWYVLRLYNEETEEKLKEQAEPKKD